MIEKPYTNEQRALIITARIRESYSQDKETAILRKATAALAAGSQPDQEYFDYNTAVEEIKAGLPKVEE